MIKVLVAVSMLSFTSFAEHRVNVTVDGFQYSCNGGQGGSSDPNCIQTLTDLCKNETPQSGGVCFDKATTACKGKASGYSACVVQTTRTCKNQTPMSGSACLEKALSACEGNADAIQDLLESATRAR